MSDKYRQIVNEIFDLLESAGDFEYYGESISQLDHALQCAELASNAGSDEETIIAALLHDIGHICDPNSERMGNVGVMHHESIGANYLRERGFSEKIAQLIESHVDAKRYLVFKNPKYAAQLSAASVETLGHQGGAMSESQAAAFEQDPLFESKLRIRSWDEQGKKVGWQVPDLNSYREMLIRHLA